MHYMFNTYNMLNTYNTYETYDMYAYIYIYIYIPISRAPFRQASDFVVKGGPQGRMFSTCQIPQLASEGSFTA